jgi:putative flippase GtrA
MVENAQIAETEAVRLLDRPGLRQFIKFCIIGATSFAIDAVISTYLTFHYHMWWVLAKTISFSLAVTNGFYWNQRWTFRAVGHRKHHEQYTMFFGVNIVGWLLNVFIMKMVFWAATGTFRGQHPKPGMWAVGTILATGIVVFWNFFANKHWTFKPPEQP